MSMTLTAANASSFIAWVLGLDPGFSANMLQRGIVRVLVAVTPPGGQPTLYVHQNQTLTAVQNPDLSWTVTVN